MTEQNIRPLLNKVAASGLISLDLEELSGLPVWQEYDLKDLLIQGLLLREKDFREGLKHTDWKAYKDAHVAVHCSTDALIPKWAYMLVASSLQDWAAWYCFGNMAASREKWLLQCISALDTTNFLQKKIVVKGCSDKVDIPASAYLEITKKLLPVAQSIMYGEPCSTVPVYKKKPDSP